MREGRYGDMQLVGEVYNPFQADTGVWISVLYRDAKGILLGGHSVWLSEVSRSGNFAFRKDLNNADEIPEHASTAFMVYCHNNNLSSWQEMITR